jgi:hypothetical protein
MSSATMSSASFRSILGAALDSYTKQTGINLAKHPSADKIQSCRSPDDMSFEYFQKENPRLTTIGIDIAT